MCRTLEMSFSGKTQILKFKTFYIINRIVLNSQRVNVSDSGLEFSAIFDTGVTTDFPVVCDVFNHILQKIASLI